MAQLVPFSYRFRTDHHFLPLHSHLGSIEIPEHIATSLRLSLTHQFGFWRCKSSYWLVGASWYRLTFPFFGATKGQIDSFNSFLPPSSFNWWRDPALWRCISPKHTFFSLLGIIQRWETMLTGRTHCQWLIHATNKI